MFLFLIALLTVNSDTWLIKNSLRPELDSALAVIHQRSVRISGSASYPALNRLIESLLFDLSRKRGLKVVTDSGPVLLSFNIDAFELSYRKIYRGIFKKPDFERSLRIRLFLKITEDKTIELAKLIEVTKIDTIAMKDVKKVHNFEPGNVSESSGVPVGVSMLIGVLFYFIYFIIK